VPAQRELLREKDLASLARAGFSLEVARAVLACTTEDELAALTRS
jgi:hypothetical protein